MLSLLGLFIASLIDAVTYRIRGGGWVTLGSDIACRAIWAGGQIAAYMITHAHNFSLLFILTLVVTSFLAMMVPHAWVQNMGTWATNQKKWPGFFLPLNWPTPWVPGSLKATEHDFAGMMGVGFFRGLIVFIPALFLGSSFGGVIAAISIITFGQAAAYLAGRFTPITVTKSLEAYGPTWGEFWNGAAWALALAAL